MKLKKGYLLCILFFTSIVVISWIIFNVYQAAIGTTISQKIAIEITPIKPDFDSKVIEKIRNREKVSPVYEVTATLSQPVFSPSQQVPLNPAGTSSASVTQQNASGGAVIKL